MGRKVGVITLPGNFNYGNRLQCFAMCKAVESLGVQAFSLERKRLFSLPRWLFHSLKKSCMSAVGKKGPISAEDARTPARVLSFERFATHIPTVILSGNGFEEAARYDCLVIGSDQVWNPNEICHQEKWYFAKFAETGRRVAVAASLGIDSFSTEHQMRSVVNGIRGFEKIAVRERRGAELIKECSGVDVEVVCDPTLVLSAAEWRSMADSRYTPSVSYVFTYLLGGVNEEAAEVLKKVTDNGRIPIVPLSDRQKPGEPDAGPAEFIDLIDHATHVVTDSFHAAVFSSILQTPLTIVHREGAASMFSRLEQLSEMLGIQEKIYGSPTFDPLRAGDYDGVPEAIAHEKAHFMKYLEGCLNG